MFRAYAVVVRAAYLSAIVVAPLFMAENLVELFRFSSIDLGGMLWFLLFAALLWLPSARAWLRIAAHEELVPTRRLRSRPFVAVPVALVCLLALLTTAAFVHAKWFVEIDFEGPENVPFIVTLLLYSIALPIAEWLLVGVRPRSVPVC